MLLLLTLSKYGLLRDALIPETINSMGVISRSIDKLPRWVQIILIVLGLVVFVYGIANEGWIFILKAIFSPEI
jgi:hypothetical protein